MLRVLLEQQQSDEKRPERNGGRDRASLAKTVDGRDRLWIQLWPQDDAAYILHHLGDWVQHDDFLIPRPQQRNGIHHGQREEEQLRGEFAQLADVAEARV